MTADHRVIFSGKRWQTARCRHVGTTGLFELATTGHGREWECPSAEGFWRSFANLNLSDGSAIETFVQQRGDPYGELPNPTHTGHWKNLQALLGTAARAWEPEDRHGVSRITTDRKRLRLAEHFLRDNPVPLLREVEPVLDPRGGPRVILRASSLASFMTLSAASAIERRIPMRRCLHCDSWLEINRRDARFCSSSCRAFHSLQKKGDVHGERS